MVPLPSCPNRARFPSCPNRARWTLRAASLCDGQHERQGSDVSANPRLVVVLIGARTVNPPVHPRRREKCGLAGTFESRPVCTEAAVLGFRPTGHQKTCPGRSSGRARVPGARRA
jgi:hypothetical protein